MTNTAKSFLIMIGLGCLLAGYHIGMYELGRQVEEARVACRAACYEIATDLMDEGKRPPSQEAAFRIVEDSCRLGLPCEPELRRVFR